jgi:hypothetical protein
MSGEVNVSCPHCGANVDCARTGYVLAVSCSCLWTPSDREMVRQAARDTAALERSYGRPIRPSRQMDMLDDPFEESHRSHDDD